VGWVILLFVGEWRMVLTASIISKYPIVPHASVSVVRAIGSVSHNSDNLHITACFVTCVCSTGCVVAAPRHCLSIMLDDCGSYHLPYSAQTAAIPCDNCLRMNCMFQHLTSFRTELRTLEGKRLQPHNTDLFF